MKLNIHIFNKILNKTEQFVAIITKYVSKGNYSKVYEAQYTNNENKSQVCIIKCIVLKPHPQDIQPPIKDPQEAENLLEDFLLQQRQIQNEIFFLQKRNLYLDYIKNCKNSGSLFLVIKKAPGISLLNFVYSHSFSTLNWLRKLELSINLFEELVQLHKEGCIHRDLSFSNIFYNAQNNKFTLIDFGLAKHAKINSQGVEELIDDATEYGDNSSIQYGYSDPAFFEQKTHTGSDILSLAAFVFGFMPKAITIKNSEGKIILEIPYQEDGSPTNFRFFKHGFNLYSQVNLSSYPEIKKLFINLITKCLNKEPTQRPSASNVVNQLQSIHFMYRNSPCPPLAPTPKLEQSIQDLSMPEDKQEFIKCQKEPTYEHDNSKGLKLIL